MLVGVAATTRRPTSQYVAGKIRDLRVFEGDDGKPMDRSVVESAAACSWSRSSRSTATCARGGVRRSTTPRAPDDARALYEDS